MIRGRGTGAADGRGGQLLTSGTSTTTNMSKAALPVRREFIIPNASASLPTPELPSPGMAGATWARSTEEGQYLAPPRHGPEAALRWQ
jgi:hypothetical protein